VILDGATHDWIKAAYLASCKGRIKKMELIPLVIQVDATRNIVL
jgi:hypothetical protein